LRVNRDREVVLLLDYIALDVAVNV
jgi:hypothetical protein